MYWEDRLAMSASRYHRLGQQQLRFLLITVVGFFAITGCFPFDHANLVAKLVMADFIHEGVDEQQPPTACTLDIFGVSGVTQRCGVKTGSIIADSKSDLFVGCFPT